MPWIEVHGELFEHPKTLALAQAMGWEVDVAAIKLVRLWHWCTKYALDGDLRRFNDAQLAGAMCVDFALADRLKGALVAACWLDREPYFRIHDWWDYAKHYIKIKYKDKPERWMEIQRAYSGVTGAVTEGVTQANQTDLTNLPDKAFSLCGGTSAGAGVPGVGSLAINGRARQGGSKVQSVRALTLPTASAGNGGERPGGGEWEGSGLGITEMAENGLMGRCRDVLGGDVMNNDGGKWLNRMRKGRRSAEKLERILNEMERMDKEGEPIKDRGAYAEDLWKRWQ